MYKNTYILYKNFQARLLLGLDYSIYSMSNKKTNYGIIKEVFFFLVHDPGQSLAITE